MSSDTGEVVALERQFWSNANDPAFFERTMAEGGIAVIEPLGFIEKPEAVRYAAGGKSRADVTFKDLIVREVASGVVVLAYHGEGRAAGEEKPYRGSICSVYVKRDGRWQSVLTAHQPWTPTQSPG